MLLEKGQVGGLVAKVLMTVSKCTRRIASATARIVRLHLASAAVSTRALKQGAARLRMSHQARNGHNHVYIYM